MMMLGSILLVVFWAGVSFCGTCKEPNFDCCRNINTDDLLDCTSDEDFITNVTSWSPSSSIPGHVEIGFPLPKWRCNRYKMKLVFLNLTEGSCTGSEDLTGLIHSKVTANIKECNADERSRLPSCEQAIAVTFKHVFEGCYSLKVTPAIGSNTRIDSTSSPRYIKSDYEKTGLDNPRPIFTHQYFDVTKLLYTSSRFFEEYIDNLQIQIDLDNNSSNHKCDSATGNCETIKPSKEKPTCKVVTGKNTLFKCEFSDIKPGNYCLHYHITDERCCSDTVWDVHNKENIEMCYWTYMFQAEEIAMGNVSATVTSNPMNDHMVYIITGVVAIIVGLLIAMFVIYIRSYIWGHDPGSYPTLPETQLECIVSAEAYRIFLLYARDCQPFMELMGSLREVLEEATKSEVIDCLDPCRWNEVSRSPMEWVRGHIEQNNTKVVVVATNCAYLRQQAHINQATITYKQPEAYDNLFLCGLKTLTDSLSPDVYRKISVIRFEGFSDDENLFNHLTPYTRFVLPTHLHKLVCSLQPSESQDEDIFHVETREVQKLKQDLTNLIDFRKNNVNYLQDMLIIQR